MELCKVVQAHTLAESKQFSDEENIYGNQFAITDQALRPIVVHCAGGFDRTGVFAAVYICMQRLYEENRADVFSVVKNLRTQRSGMVATPEQYAFTYRCVVDYLDSIEESIYGNLESDGITARANSLFTAKPAAILPRPTRQAPLLPILGESTEMDAFQSTPVVIMQPPTRQPPTLPRAVTENTR